MNICYGSHHILLVFLAGIALESGITHFLRYLYRATQVVFAEEIGLFLRLSG